MHGKKVLAERISRGELVRWSMCVWGGGGAVVLWGENFSLVNFCLVEWGSFVEEGEGREGLTVEKPSFYFAPRG